MERWSQESCQRYPSLEVVFIRENGLKIVHKEDLYKLLSIKGKETVPMKLREDIVRRLERFIIELE